VFSPSQKRGKFWSLSEDQCAICAENAQFNLNISEPTNLFTSLAASSSIDTSGHTEMEPPAHPFHNPYQTSCGHIYCYHCIAERVMRTVDEADDDSGWECLRCGEQVKEAHRYIIEIIESERSESERSESDYEFSSDLDMRTDLSGSMGSYSESGFSE
jgi:peroxin-2